MIKKGFTQIMYQLKQRINLSTDVGPVELVYRPTHNKYKVFHNSVQRVIAIRNDRKVPFCGQNALCFESLLLFLLLFVVVVVTGRGVINSSPPMVCLRSWCFRFPPFRGRSEKDRCQGPFCSLFQTPW